MNKSIGTDTIIAHSTPHGSGALAILRLSGAQALSITNTISILPGEKNILEVKSHTIHFGWIVDDSNVKIDQVMFSVMHGPRTFTGEHVVEISCHNNQFIIEAIIERAMSAGARLARRGEFTEQAFINGKLDLMQAEALNDLIHAQTQLALKKSLSQLEGTLSSWIHELEQELLRALAWCEASFEFLDEELEFGHQIKEHLEKLLARIKINKGTHDVHRQIRQGVRIALVGSVNAGKSSVFNMLLGQKRAIVTPFAGTTRDSIESSITLDGMHVTLIDTAGIRTTSDIIEQEGINRSFQQAQTADIVMLIFDGNRNLNAEEESFYGELSERYAEKTLLIHNKSDLPALCNKYIHALKISCVGESESLKAIKKLNEEILKKIDHLFKKCDTPFLLNERQYRTLVDVEQTISLIIETFLQASQKPYELISFHLREALEQLTGLTGKSISQAALDRVFKEFCVGK